MIAFFRFVTDHLFRPIDRLRRCVICWRALTCILPALLFLCISVTLISDRRADEPRQTTELVELLAPQTVETHALSRLSGGIVTLSPPVAQTDSQLPEALRIVTLLPPRNSQMNDAVPRSSNGTGPAKPQAIASVQLMPLRAVESGPDGDPQVATDEESADQLKPLAQVNTNIVVQGKVPTDAATIAFSKLGTQRHISGTSRPWVESTYTWDAPKLCHQPLYFEDINLERHGHSRRVVQPLFSAARFYGTVPLLPYLATVNRPNDCIYALGHYRPGSPAPHHHHRIPLRLDAMLVEGAALTGLFFVVP